MLDAMTKKWDMSKSKLYEHISNKGDWDGFEQFITSFINTLKNDKSDELSFVKDNKEFCELLNKDYN